MLPRWGAVVCASTAHIHTDEAGAPLDRGFLIGGIMVAGLAFAPPVAQRRLAIATIQYAFTPERPYGPPVAYSVLIGVTIAMYSFVQVGTPVYAIVGISLCLGFFNSLQFSSMNSIAYADVERGDSSMASTMASSMQQLSMSFGLACGSLLTAWYLGGLPQTDQIAVSNALHAAFITLGIATIVSSDNVVTCLFCLGFRL